MWVLCELKLLIEHNMFRVSPNYKPNILLGYVIFQLEQIRICSYQYYHTLFLTLYLFYCIILTCVKDSLCHSFVTTVKLPVLTNVLITQWRGHNNNDTRDSIRFCSRFVRLSDLISEPYRVEVKS